AVERVNGYLKNNYQLSNVRFNGGKATATHVSLIQLTYNAVKFAVERLTKKTTPERLKMKNHKIGFV
ncbi:transposase, partial [Listeria weihenstephanensis FSL R9-0317]